MKTWRVVITEKVRNDLDDSTYYLFIEKSNEQAANAVLDDFYETIDVLAEAAGALKPLDSMELEDYRKIRFRRHNYYLIYHLDGDTAIVDRMFHDLQDLDRVFERDDN